MSRRPKVASEAVLLRKLRRFLAGELKGSSLELWILQNPGVARLIGEDLYLDLLSSDLTDEGQLTELRAIAAAALQNTQGEIR